MPPGSYIGVSPTNSRWFPVFCPRCVPRAKKWRCVVRGQQPGFVKIYPYSLRVQINITCTFKILTLPKRQKTWNWSQNMTIYHKDIQMLLVVSPLSMEAGEYKTHQATTAATQTDPTCRTWWAGPPSTASLPYSPLVLLTAVHALAPYLRMEIQVSIDSFGNAQKHWLFRAQHWRVPHETPGTLLVLCQPQHPVFGQDAFEQKQRSHQTLLLVWCLLLSGCWKWARKWARNHRTSSSPSPKAFHVGLLNPSQVLKCACQPKIYNISVIETDPWILLGIEKRWSCFDHTSELWNRVQFTSEKFTLFGRNCL